MKNDKLDDEHAAEQYRQSRREAAVVLRAALIAYMSGCGEEAPALKAAIDFLEGEAQRLSTPEGSRERQ